MSGKESTSLNLALNLGKILPGGSKVSSGSSGVLKVERKVPKLALTAPSKAVVPSKTRFSPRKVFVKESKEVQLCKYKLSDETGESKVAIKKLKGKPPLQSRTPRGQRSSPITTTRYGGGVEHADGAKHSDTITPESRTVQRFSFDIQTEEKLSRTEPVMLWGTYDDKDPFQLAQANQYVGQGVKGSDASSGEAEKKSDVTKDLDIMKLVRETDGSTEYDISAGDGGKGAPETTKPAGFTLGLPEMDPAMLSTRNDSPVVYKGWNSMSIPQQEGIQGYGRALVLKSFEAKEFDFGHALDGDSDSGRPARPAAAAASAIEYVKASAISDRQPQQYKGKVTRELPQTQIMLKTESSAPSKSSAGLKGNKLRPAPSDLPYTSAPPYGAAALIGPVSPTGNSHSSVSPRGMLRRGELQLGVSGVGGRGAAHDRQQAPRTRGCNGVELESVMVDEVELGRSMASQHRASPPPMEMMDRALGEAAMSPTELLGNDSPRLGDEDPSVRGAGVEVGDQGTALESSFFRAILRADRHGAQNTEQYVDIHYPDSLGVDAGSVTRVVPGFTQDPPRETLINPEIVSPAAYQAVMKGAGALVADNGGGGKDRLYRTVGKEGSSGSSSSGLTAMELAIAPEAPPAPLPALYLTVSDVPEGDEKGERDGGRSQLVSSRAPFAASSVEEPEAEPESDGGKEETKDDAVAPFSIKVPAACVIMNKMVQSVSSFMAESAVTDTLLNFISSQQGEQERGPSAEEMVQLTALEQKEYLGFPSATRCYYGRLEAKMKTELFVGANNYGYDDAEGNYQVKAGDHLAYRLEVRDLLGWGSFGAVYSCWDHFKNRNCAVKICRNKASIRQQVDAELETLLLLRTQAKDLSRRMSIMSLSNEARRKSETAASASASAVIAMPLLGAAEAAAGSDDPSQLESPAVEFGQAHNCVTIQESFIFRHHRCLVFQSFGINLYEYLKSMNFQGMGLGQVRKVALQLLKALKHLKTLGIVHCDIKPENVLLKGDPRGNDDSGMEVVLCDFGSASFVGGNFPSYVQSRYYRAPEVVLRLRSNQKDGDVPIPAIGAPAYSFEVDMWSLAAMLPELRTGNVCFPAESESDLFACYCDVLGMPPSALLERVDPLIAQDLVEVDATGAQGVYALKETLRVSPLGNPRCVGARTIAMLARARKTDASFVDFLTHGLAWDPQERLTVEAAVDHDWVTKINLHQHRTPGAARRSPAGDASN